MSAQGSQLPSAKAELLPIAPSAATWPHLSVYCGAGLCRGDSLAGLGGARLCRFPARPRTLTDANAQLQGASEPLPSSCFQLFCRPGLPAWEAGDADLGAAPQWGQGSLRRLTGLRALPPSPPALSSALRESWRSWDIRLSPEELSELHSPFMALKRKYLCDSLSHLPGENSPVVMWFFIIEDSQPLAKFTPSDRKQPCLHVGGGE